MKTEAQRFRVSRAFGFLIAGVGGLMFLPPSVAWPLDLLRGASPGEGAPILVIVTAIGWAGLALIVRFISRPRLVLRGGELLEHRLLFTRRFPLSQVRSIDRVHGAVAAVKPRSQDSLYLFRPHPAEPWLIDLGFVDEPEKFMDALRGQCRVTYGDYSPRNAPPWARG